MNILERIQISIKYRWSRMIYHIWDKKIGEIKLANWTKPTVDSVEDTVNRILKNKCSISRYGDGEFNLIFGEDIGFQQHSSEIGKRLLQVLQSQDDRVVIAIPDIFESVDEYSDFARNWWNEYRLSNIDKLRRIIPSPRHYGNTNCTRFASDYKEDKAESLLPLYRKIWNGRDVYIVEGEQTRIGVGNDLLDNAANVYRILAPAKNAYDVYDRIVESIMKHVPVGALVIIALGPTATIMAYDLAKMGYQALDLGHFDIQYEYHIRGIHTKEAIPGKYVNEASTVGQTVDDSAIKDYRYKKSIIDNIKLS